MREVMDAFNDPRVKKVIGMFSAQVAKTTTFENVLGYHAHHDPSPIMVVLPTLEIAEAFSKDRLSPMIRDTPALKERFAEAGSKTSGDTLLHKKFPGGHVTLAGANSFNSLASRPIRIVLGDEAAKWKANEKGSPFRQVSARVRAFWNSKEGYFSTPTDSLPDNEFNQLWEQSDKRLYFVPCPHCNELVVMAFDELDSSLPSEVDVPRAVLRWLEGTPAKLADGRTIRRADEAWFECLQCGGRINDVDRHRAVRDGEWRATQEFYGTAGFWGWQALSPFSDAVDIANEWLGALGSSVSLQSVKNETLGLPWVERGDAPDWKRLFDRREPYQIATVPAGALLLTAGVDCQPDRLEIQVIGWGRKRRSWLVDYIVLNGDIARLEVWVDLTKILGTIYRHESGADLVVRKLGIDSGYDPARVYDWARQHRSGNVAVFKGGPDSMTAIIGSPSPAEITVSGKRLDSGVKVSLVNVSHFKSEFYGRLRLDLPNLEKGEEYPEGFFHFCSISDTEEYCRQITAEQLVTRNRKGYAKREWEKIRPRNEALDTWIYARAAAYMLGVDRMRESDWDAIEGHVNTSAVLPPSAMNQTEEASAPRPSNWFSQSRRGGGWFQR